MKGKIMNAWHQTSAYWLSKFREALSNKEWADAEVYYHRSQKMKKQGDYIERRHYLNELLSEICEKAGFVEDTNGKK